MAKPPGILSSALPNYTVTITNTTDAQCGTDAVAVTANTTPSKPGIEIFGNTTLCGTNTVALLAPLSFINYLWSDGQTTAGITVSAPGSYTVQVGNAPNCLSPPSDPVTVISTGQPCVPTGGSNTPPVVASTTLTVGIEGHINFDLTTILSDSENNIDFATLRVINNQTARGATATVDVAYFLNVDYTGDPFTGNDRLTLEVCDLGGLCAQQFIDIEVVGSVVVFNGLSPDGDGKNDFMFIKYIDVVEGAAQNKVTIFNRWGDLVFDIQNYNNIDRVFSGLSNKGAELPSGTYYYKIEFTGNLQPLTGFITLIR